MRLNITDFWHHTPSAPEDTADLPRLQSLLYLAILIVGAPLVVGITMFAVQYLFDGVLWLMPN